MKTKTLVIRYVLEFVVIILGVSISFYIEKQNALKYKETIKNQSLSRILNNSKIDSLDFEYNLEAHQNFIKSCYWVLKNKNNLSAFSRDSIGYHFGFAIDGNTFFVDNPEEYRGLKNSGLIELIENDSLVSALQNKHAQRIVITKMEEFIADHIKNNSLYLYGNIRFISEKKNTQGYAIDRTYTGDFTIPQVVIQNIEQKLRFHQYYVDQTKYELRRNAYIKKLIKKEIADQYQ